MGNFFTNLQVRSPKKAEVVEALKQILTAPAYVSRSSGGWVSAYPKETENQDLEELKRIAKQVSDSLTTHVFCFLVHDDDLFVFSLFDSGNLIGDYECGPGYMGNADYTLNSHHNSSTPIDPALVVPLCKTGVTEGELRDCLFPKRTPGFAGEQTAEFALLLGIPEDRAVVGFNYVAEGDSELDSEAEKITLLQIGAVDTANDVKHPPEYWTKQLFEVGIGRSLDKLRRAIANGADPNGRDADGTTALILYSMH